MSDMFLSFYVFESLLLTTKNSKMKHYYNLKELCSIWICFKIQFISVIKAEFSASLLQTSVSHDPSEIILICWFAAQETFLIIINVENSCAAQYFVETDTFYFPWFFDE